LEARLPQGVAVTVGRHSLSSWKLTIEPRGGSGPEAGLRNAEETMKCYRLLSRTFGELLKNGCKPLLSM
jgi:hypothetical protein